MCDYLKSITCEIFRQITLFEIAIKPIFQKKNTKLFQFVKLEHLSTAQSSLQKIIFILFYLLEQNIIIEVNTPSIY